MNRGGRTICPCCGRDVRVNLNGTIAAHWPPEAGFYYCPGSREPVAAGPSPAACEHEWHWLTEVQLVLNRRHELVRGENVHCPLCGARTWAHGRNERRPYVQTIANPTTEGS